MDRAVKRAQRRVEWEPLDLCGKLDVEFGAEHRAGREQRHRFAAEPRDTVADGLSDARRELDRLYGERFASVVHIPDQLLDEERVAGGLCADARSDSISGLPAGRLGQQRGHVLRREPVQRDLLHLDLPPKIGEQSGKRLTRTELGLPVGAKQQHRRRLQSACQVRKQPQSRLVRPMQVVQRQHQRALGRSDIEHVTGCLEHAQPGSGLGCAW